ncbi:MAG: hypothetical protein ABSG57_04275 [Candidatus Bathyarchaeia archaeon]
MPKPPRNDKVLYWDSERHEYVLLPAPLKAHWGLKRKRIALVRGRERAGMWKDVRKEA